MTVMGLDDVLDVALDAVSTTSNDRSVAPRFRSAGAIRIPQFASAAALALMTWVGAVNGTLAWAVPPDLPAAAHGHALSNYFDVDETAIWNGALALIRQAGKDPDQVIAGAVKNLDTLRHAPETVPISLYNADGKRS